MLVKELKELLKQVPDNAEILLGACGHYCFTDSRGHGAACVYHITIGVDKADVFAFSATDCGFNPMNLNFPDIKIIQKLEREKNNENH